jgi:hypothetical protein
MKQLFFGFMLCMFVGCGGVTFEATRLTNDLPETFKQRNLYLDESGTLRYKLTEIVGRVIYQDSAAHRSDVRTVILPESYVPVLEVIKAGDGLVFEGMVDRNAATKGSYLAFAGSLSSKQVAMVSIQDRNLVFIQNRDIPRAKLIEEARQSVPNPSIRRLWIQGALLSSIDIATLDSISRSASGVVGTTIGVEGNVYNKKAEAIHDYRISILALDLDRLAEMDRGTHLLPIAELLNDPNVLKRLSVIGAVMFNK